MPDWLTPILVVAIPGAITVIGARWGRKGDRENALIDQLQEQLTSSAARIERLEAQVSEMQQQIARLLSRDTLWRIHADRCEAIIADAGMTPPQRPAPLREDAA